MLASRLISAATVCLLLATSSVMAQLRSLPDDAKRGRIRHVQEMLVEIDGTQVRLAPGAQIRSPENRLLVPSAVPPGALVKFTLDKGGLLQRVWLLTDEEAARPDKRRD